MATATRTRPRKPAARPRPKPSRINLWEDVVRSSGPLKVDRDKGVIYGVKVLGWDSDNDRKYLPEAGKQAIRDRLYEDCKVFTDHPAKPSESRAADDGFGKLENVRYAADGLYADLHYFKSHPLAERICEDVERGIGFFGLSHNAQGEGDTQDGVFVVRKIVEVRSVDIVSEAATVSNLWESKGRTQMKTGKVAVVLRERVLPKLKGKAARELLTIIEADGMDAADMAYEDDVGDDEGDFRDHLFSAFKAVHDSDPDMGNKILAMLKMDKPADETPVEEEDDSDDDDEAKDTEEEVCDELPGKKKAEEGRKPKKPAKGARRIVESKRLTEAGVKRLIKLAGVTEDRALVEGLLAMRDEDKIVSHLEYLKGLTVRTPGSRPRSQAPGVQPVVEGSVPKEIKDQVRSILS